MPQLDVSTYPSQLFWLVVCFLALYFLLSYVALPKIEGVLKKREETLEEKINIASTYREEAENILADYEKKLEEARQEAQVRYKKASDLAKEEISRKQKQKLAKLNDRLNVAEQDLYRSRVDAGEELKASVREVANAILDKITGGTSQIKRAPKKKRKG